MRTRAVLAASVLPVMLVLSACGSDEEPTDTASDAPAASGDCTYTETGDAAKEAELPPAEPVATESLTIATNRGDIGVTLDADRAPCTVSSFVSLAEQGYFDDTQCHRLVPGFVLQCGDPSATGMGGPGYSFPDELQGDETYPAGTLAMANSGPDTNGSQFFIVLADAQLPPSYTVFGQVDEAGLGVAQEIEKDGVQEGTETPVEDVVIESVS